MRIYISATPGGIIIAAACIVALGFLCVNAYYQHKGSEYKTKYENCKSKSMETATELERMELQLEYEKDCQNELWNFIEWQNKADIQLDSILRDVSRRYEKCCFDHVSQSY